MRGKSSKRGENRLVYFVLTINRKLWVTAKFSASLWVDRGLRLLVEAMSDKRPLNQPIYKNTLEHSADWRYIPDGNSCNWFKSVIIAMHLEVIFRFHWFHQLKWLFHLTLDWQHLLPAFRFIFVLITYINHTILFIFQSQRPAVYYSHSGRDIYRSSEEHYFEGINGLGNSPSISERTREVIVSMMRANKISYLDQLFV